MGILGPRRASLRTQSQNLPMDAKMHLRSPGQVLFVWGDFAWRGGMGHQLKEEGGEKRDYCIANANEGTWGWFEEREREGERGDDRNLRKGH